MGTHKRLMLFAENKMTLKMWLVCEMTMGCILLTDSGGSKRYVAGYLDNGKPFVEKCPEESKWILP